MIYRLVLAAAMGTASIVGASSYVFDRPASTSSGVVASAPATTPVVVAPSGIESLVNEHRIQDGKQSLTSNVRLRLAARVKADHMLAGDYWDHISPEGVTPWVIIKIAGYDYKLAGENLARGYTDDGETVQAWMDSPSHRENMLNENFTEQGICVREGTLGG